MNESLTGNLLVASSLAADPVYSRGVCLVVHHDESNVIGVMLNRPMKPSAEALLELLSQDSENRISKFDDTDDSLEEFSFDDEPVPSESVADDSVSGESVAGESLFGQLHFGGPRSGPVVAIHQTSEFAEAETGTGIYVAAQKHHLEELVRDHPAPYRLIVGHLGWELDELAAELEAGLWHIVPATTEAVFSAASDMWPRLVRRATSNSLAQWIGTPDVVAAGELN